MVESGTELITLAHGENYAPTFVSTDKRKGPGEKTTVGYWQIGDPTHHGFARGPVFKIEFADLSGVTTATHVKIWGVDNQDSNAPIYPLSYFKSTAAPWNTIIHVYLQKFEFCDSSGNTVTPDGDYLVVGYKKKVIPIAW